jgi:alanyl-tRNA synthetase
MKTKLSEIVARQVDYFSKDFPDLKENKDEIIKLVNVEEDKLKAALYRL